MLDNYATSRLVITGDRPEMRFTISPSILYKYFYIESFAIPIIYDTFPAFNVTFVDGASVSHNIAIVAGQYDILGIMSYLATQMGILYPAGAPYVDSPNPNFTWKIDSTAGEFSLTVLNSVAAQRLGLIGTVQSVGGILTTQKYNMSTTNINIETSLPVYTQSQAYDNITQPSQNVLTNVKSGSTFTASVAITAFSPSGLVNDLSASLNSGSFGTHHQVLNNTIHSIDIRLTDELGVLIDTYPQRWTIVFLFYNYRTPF